MEHVSPRHTSTRLLLATSCVIVIIGSLKLAAAFFIPILLAAFLATVSYPITAWLRRNGVPRFGAVLLTVLVDFLFLTGVVLIAIALAGDFQAKWKGEDGEQGYESLMWNKLEQGAEGINSLLETWGFEDTTVEINIEEARRAVELEEVFPEAPELETAPMTPERLVEQLFQLDLGKVLDLGTNVAFGVLSFVGSALLIMILTIFMLSEARMLGRQLRAVCEARGPDLQQMLHAAQDIQRYLGIKTIISLVTGVLAGFLCWAAGLDFFILWGILAFVLNYIPVVGSIIAGVPPVLLALLTQDGPGAALAIAIGYAAINVFLGNFIEPMLMGRRFGLSTLVILLAVLFWGWLWGPAGMLLAVPLTMVLKAGLEHSPDFRWLAIAISKEKTPPKVAEVRPEEELAVEVQ